MYNVYSSDSEKEDEAWQYILEEDNQVARLHEKISRSSFPGAKAEARRRRKVARDKAKPKFSLRLQSQTEKRAYHSVVKTETEGSSMSEEEPSLNKIQHVISTHSTDKSNIQHLSTHSMTHLLEELQHDAAMLQKSDDVSAEVVSIRKIGSGCSISNMLENLEKDSPLQLPSETTKKRTKVRKAQIAERRIRSQLGKRSLDDEGTEHLDSTTASEDEDNNKNDLVLSSMTKGQTMTDIFQEVFSISVVDAEEVPLATKSGIGYYGRLQQIMQRDKDRQIEFFKQLESNASTGTKMKILSRLLDAKLTICRCLLCDKTVNAEIENCSSSYGRSVESVVKLVIFSKRVCRNVELEVGNFIRVHAPWKEVQIGEDDSIILCTYFSQFMP